MDAYRDMRLCEIGGGPPSKWDDESAIRLDWLIAADDARKRAEANIQRSQSG